VEVVGVRVQEGVELSIQEVRQPSLFRVVTGSHKAEEVLTVLALELVAKGFSLSKVLLS
jgi:hypothetical protein